MFDEDSMALSNTQNDISENSPLLREHTSTRSSTEIEGANGLPDAEAVVGDAQETPLFEGNKEMIAKLPYLLPPLAIGVTIFCFLPCVHLNRAECCF